jgi:probable O-glycosylation ligase (exosortase A-associated)
MRRAPVSEPPPSWRFRRVPHIGVSLPVALVAAACLLAIISSWIVLNHEPRPAAALCLALIGGVAILLNPFLGVLAYYILAFMRPQETFWGLADTRLTMLISLATLIGAVFHFARRPSLQFLKQKQCFLIAMLWLFLYLSTRFGDFGSPEPKWMDYYNKLFLIYFVVLALANSEKKLVVLAWVIMLSIAYLAYWANEMYFLHGWSVVHGPGKPGATFYDENDFAMVMVMGVPFIWYLMRGTKNALVRIALLGLLPVAAHGIMTTFSRGGFLGLTASMAVIALREKNRRLGGLMLACGVVFFLAFAGAEYRARIHSISTYEEDRSATGRIESWKVGTAMAVKNPLFGVGLKRYMQAFPYYSNLQPRAAHNSWVQLGGECGLVALGCYAGLVLLTVRSLRRVGRRIPHLPPESGENSEVLVRMMEVSLIGYLVCGFFLSMEDFEFFYVLVAMSQVLDRTTAARVGEAAQALPAPVRTLSPSAAA